jgi:uncharacterized protein YcfJ
MRTITRLYDNYSDAVAVVTALEAADLRRNREISLIANENARGRDTTVETQRTERRSEAGPGAAIGATAGGVVGILTGLGLMAIPGVGPLVAAGWLATTLAGAGVGAVAGGIIGSLVNAGVDRDEAEVYEEGVRRGGTLVAVKADDADVLRVEEIMDSRQSRPWQAHRDEYTAAGWAPSHR